MISVRARIAHVYEWFEAQYTLPDARRPRMAIPFKVVDLFAGAGGLTLGFKEAGFTPILAVESEPDFADTYRENFGDHVLPCRIENFIDAGIPVKANVVIGGPPCQGFSNLTGNRRSDPRRAMWKYFMNTI